jgi:hypothetical protein
MLKTFRAVAPSEKKDLSETEIQEGLLRVAMPTDTSSTETAYKELPRYTQRIGERRMSRIEV